LRSTASGSATTGSSSTPGASSGGFSDIHPIVDDLQVDQQEESMLARFVVPLALVLSLGLAACGGGGDGGAADHALGEEVVVEHAQDPNGTPSSLGITVLAVRKGTQEEMKQGGFKLEGEELTRTPYYVDTRWKNQGAAPVKRQHYVAMEDQDGNLITSTTIIDLGGKPFEQCPKAGDAKVAPNQSYKSCSLFLVPEGHDPKKVSFLPTEPGKPTEFVYWNVE
jgi:hypothetical protein